MPGQYIIHLVLDEDHAARITDSIAPLTSLDDNEHNFVYGPVAVSDLTARLVTELLYPGSTDPEVVAACKAARIVVETVQAGYQELHPVA